MCSLIADELMPRMSARYIWAMALSLFFALGCQAAGDQQTVVDAQWYSDTAAIMGTRVAVELKHPDPTRRNTALPHPSCPQQFDAAIHCVSFGDPTQINIDSRMLVTHSRASDIELHMPIIYGGYRDG